MFDQSIPKSVVNEKMKMLILIFLFFLCIFTFRHQWLLFVCLNSFNTICKFPNINVESNDYD